MQARPKIQRIRCEDRKDLEEHSAVLCRDRGERVQMKTGCAVLKGGVIGHRCVYVSVWTLSVLRFGPYVTVPHLSTL